MIAQTPDDARRMIGDLVQQFQDHLETYKAKEYKEANARIDFINPFFQALGWDISNESHLAPHYREVITEDSLKIDDGTKAPDYCFTVYGQKKFFVEAKKPSVVVKDDAQPAYQVRLYGWNARLPISIISDFEEFAVYSCVSKPKEKDKATVGRIEYFTFKEYVSRIDYLWEHFSKDGVLKGRFDKFSLAHAKSVKSTMTVDRDFLLSMDEWRKALASNLALRNPKISEGEINHVVQMTIDRIIFLRFCEDRQIEIYGALRNAISGDSHFRNLQKYFVSADTKYNSGLFNLTRDPISKTVDVDDKVIRQIIDDLYPPKCPYLFSQIPVEILGHAYEQFLGKVIRLTDGHRAKIDEKPEVRHAGGVYYTPQYIVDYIVKNTLGTLTQGKTPDDVSKIKIIDPACGSGSFLLGAYQFLLDWHLDYYLKHPTPKVLTPDGSLSSAEKSRILLASIHGVDIDSQAVEVTKLSLLLKAMSGESAATVKGQFSLTHQGILPSLEGNIKCGNSLIGPDYDSGKFDMEPEERAKVRAFDWKVAFPEIFKRGGFDVVVGNPPYVRQELLTAQKPYYESAYKVFHGVADLYTYFIEKGISLLRPDGLFGIIVANKWMRANYGEPLRKWLKRQNIVEIIDFGDLPVFEGVTTYPCILIAKPGNQTMNDNFLVANVKSLDFTDLGEFLSDKRQPTAKGFLDDAGWNLAGEAEQRLLEKLRQSGPSLDQYVKGNIFRGVLTGFNEAFVIDEETRKRLIKEDKRSAEVIKPFLAGRDIKRYQTPGNDKYLILFPKGFTKQNVNGKDPWRWLEKTFPSIAKHLAPHEKAGKARYDKGDFWWELRACDYYGEFEKPKIIVPAIVNGASYTFDRQGMYSNDKTSIIQTNDLYVLAVLNSKACDFVLKKIASTKQGGYFEYKPMYFSTLPIPKAEAKDCGELAELAEQLLTATSQIAVASTPSDRDQIQNQIASLDNQIDALAYRLYGLTEDEIRLIEGSS